MVAEGGHNRHKEEQEYSGSDRLHGWEEGERAVKATLVCDPKTR